MHFQLSSLITELASTATNEKRLTFEEAMEECLCAYSPTVALFPTTVKEVNDRVSGINIGFTRYISSYLGYT